ncbi:MAG: phage terminase large subunit [Candidatus Bathyarchaeia archaeon]
MNPKALAQLAQNPILFAKLLLNFEPFSYQQQMLADQSKRILACMGRQTGKTTTIAAKAIHYAFTHPKTTTLIVSPTLRQSMIMFDKILSFITNPILSKSITRKTRTQIQLSNKSQIIALPCSEHMLRGYTAHLVICDEAAFMPENTITEIIFPMLSTTSGTAILLSTPWGKNHFFYKAFTNPQYRTYTIKSEQNPLITKEFLEEMRQTMTAEAYKREYEAQFTEDPNTYFPQDLIRKAVELAQKSSIELLTTLEQNPPPADYYAGLDFGKHQSHSALAIVKADNETVSLTYLYEFPLQTPYTQVIGHLANANKTFNLKNILVDQTGIGEPILEEIQNQGIVKAQGTKFTIQTKTDMLTHLKLLMEQNRLAIPYHRKLCQQLNEQQAVHTKTGQLQFTHPPSTHDDLLWALALAVTAAKTQPQPKLWVTPKMARGKTKLKKLRQKLLKHLIRGETH